MGAPLQDQDSTGRQLPVYPCADLVVINGANQGDSLSFAAELLLDDVYELSENASVSALNFQVAENGQFHIAPQTDIGLPGATLHLDCCVTLMPAHGETIEALILVEVDPQGNVAEIYLHPLAPLTAKTQYSLIGISRKDATRRMALLGCVSFSRGTRITTATGEQKPIETLNIGDRVLTRDGGAQEIRWIGKSTVRATGVFAPVVITAGALHNLADLTVSPEHRLFIYQRNDHIGAGRAELLVRARHLVNGKTVYKQHGGFVDYYQLLFDDHQIIFAEGISAETMLVTETTRPVLPKGLVEKFQTSQPGLPFNEGHATEVPKALLDRPDAAALLRRASSSG
ncbi:Hint domain-containing protein [Cognatishimia sp. WU-CL00825]|uniref:Hint domain-containing protein n=1 Tax=Cognatishimia sp. WU-CL00825 TaxID=3127658 RepID=UPI00310AD373